MGKMIKTDIYNVRGEVVGEASLSSELFDAPINEGVIYQTVRTYLSRQRRGTASTKERSDVSGSRRKPWPQKGTGRARAGTRQSPIWRGGGVVFGPHPRDYSLSIPKYLKKLALASALTAKIKENNIIIIDEIKAEKGKTKEIERVLRSLNIAGKALLVVANSDDFLKRAVRNIKELNISPSSTLNTYEILSHNKIILTKDALLAIESRSAVESVISKR
jgi:large subunit ribosomal protein L4